MAPGIRVTNDEPRTVSLWMRSVDSGGPLLAWGSNTDRWEISWDDQGVKLVNGSGGVRYGYGALIANQWHHLLISYPGNGADINGTRMYWDGSLVDMPASSVNGVVSTGADNDLRIGSTLDGTFQMSGDLDEVRVSEKYRNSKWAAYEYENQRHGGGLLSYELEYVKVPHFADDLNLTIVQGQQFSFQIRSLPPATEYSLSGGSLPSGVSILHGLLEETRMAFPPILTLTASNAKVPQIRH